MEESAHSAADWLLVAHKMLGFITIVLVAPNALLVTPGGRAHRRLGQTYIACMTLLYLSGTYFTFEQHPLTSYRFLRNLTFNLFGYSMLLLGWRAMPLKRTDGGRVSALDRVLFAGLVVLGIAMVPLGYKRWPMFVLGGLALLLAYIDWQEIRKGTLTAAKRLERHMRYMIASYYYVVTLLSILLFPGTVKLKWIWPSAVAGVLVLILTQPAVRERFGASRSGATRFALRFSAVLAVVLGLAVLITFVREGSLFAGVEG